MKMQTWRTDLWIQQGKVREGQIERSIETYILLYVKLDRQWEFAV